MNKNLSLTPRKERSEAKKQKLGMQANTQIGWNVNFSNREISLATERQVEAIISYIQSSNTKIPLDLNNHFGCLDLTTCATKTVQTAGPF